LTFFFWPPPLHYFCREGRPGEEGKKKQKERRLLILNPLFEAEGLDRLMMVFGHGARAPRGVRVWYSCAVWKSVLFKGSYGEVYPVLRFYTFGLLSFYKNIKKLHLQKMIYITENHSSFATIYPLPLRDTTPPLLLFFLLVRTLAQLSNYEYSRGVLYLMLLERCEFSVHAC